jgi:hypothetical protein
MSTPSNKNSTASTPPEKISGASPGQAHAQSSSGQSSSDQPGQPGPGQPGPAQGVPPIPAVDPDVLALHEALESVLHGGDPSTSPFELYWDGSDQAGSGLSLIKNALEGAVPPPRPKPPLLPGSSGKQGGP